jgi:hypothetical protein
LWLYWRQKVVQNNVNKEMRTLSVVFPLFWPPAVYKYIHRHTKILYICVHLHVIVGGECIYIHTHLCVHTQTHK